tara:strand:+ start:1044 stop:1307 length:264 start_codon:yes stop_codon:yes gene_type:complete
MPNFKQDRSKFTMKGWSPFTKKDEDKKKKNDKKQTSIATATGTAVGKLTDKMKEARDNWVPAWPGADISEKEWNAMTPKQKKNYQGE